MKTIMSALVAFSILTGFAASTSAVSFDAWTPERFWEEQQKNLP